MGSVYFLSEAGIFAFADAKESLATLLNALSRGVIPGEGAGLPRGRALPESHEETRSMKGLLTTYGFRDPKRPTQVAALLCQPAPNLTSPVVFGSITRMPWAISEGFPTPWCLLGNLEATCA